MKKILILIAVVFGCTMQLHCQPIMENYMYRKLIVNGYNSFPEVVLCMYDKNNNFKFYLMPKDSFFIKKDTFSIETYGKGFSRSERISPTEVLVYIEPWNRKNKSTIGVQYYHIDSIRVDTINFVFNSKMPMYYRLSCTSNPNDSVLLSHVTILYSYLLSKFGYDRDSAIARLIYPRTHSEHYSEFREVKVYRSPKGKFIFRSRSGKLEYPEGFVVQPKMLEYRNIGMFRRRLTECFEHYQESSDSIYYQYLVPSLLMVGNHKYLVSDEKDLFNDNIDGYYARLMYLMIYTIDKNTWKNRQLPWKRLGE